ncbi:MAG: hypothetical protein ABIJ92_01710 [Candidatus Aenigmatarchaeota archaeon]
MVDWIPDLMAINDFALSGGTDYWLSLGINLILSTVVAGILLLIIYTVLSKRSGGSVQVTKIFLIVLLINIINFLGLMGLILPFIAGIPFAGLLFPVLIWIIFLSASFHEVHFLHNIIIAIIFYFITITIVPGLVGGIAGFAGI